ncbi:hypothetical protein Nepgr_025914 [Nepenthes gracilis]|uniref:Uncharacterized protein n=1 Tax=Nepenthes gracilis TaxID=150966 RepID=A0AAD3T7L8_NEPGR|nr:hypothetical protein Nepgr_025914 [Nepenthes gracilis]
MNTRSFRNQEYKACRFCRNWTDWSGTRNVKEFKKSGFHRGGFSMMLNHGTFPLAVTFAKSQVQPASRISRNFQNQADHDCLKRELHIKMQIYNVATEELPVPEAY